MTGRQAENELGEMAAGRFRCGGREHLGKVRTCERPAGRAEEWNLLSDETLAVEPKEQGKATEEEQGSNP